MKKVIVICGSSFYQVSEETYEDLRSFVDSHFSIHETGFPVQYKKMSMLESLVKGHKDSVKVERRD